MTARRSLLVLLAAQGVAFLSSMVTVFMTAHILGPEGRGQIAFVLAAANLVGALAFGSLHVGVVNAVSHGDPSAPRRGLEIALVVAAGVIAATLPTAILAGVFGDLPQAVIVLMSGVGAALVAFNLFVLRTAQALGDDDGFKTGWFIQSFILLAVGGPLLLAIPEAMPFLLVWFSSLIVSSLMVLRRGDWGQGVRSWRSSSKIVSHSLKAHSGTIGTQVLNRMPIIALGICAAPATVGVYSVAAPISELTWLISEAFSLLAFRSAAAANQSQDERRDRRSHIGITAAAGLLIAVTSLTLLPALLPDFQDSVTLVLILLPGVLLQGEGRIAMSRLTGRGHPKASSRLGLVAAGSSVLFLPAAAYGGATVVALTATLLFSAHALGILYVDRLLMRSRVPEAPKLTEERGQQ